MNSVPSTEDLVLIGGGHSHAIVLRRFGMQPLPGVRLTLITDVSHTPYSGMLPGYVAGFYDFDECHIDLRRLARFAQAQFILDRAIGLDLQQHRVQCAHHPDIPFDWLSIDIGSTPTQAEIPGVDEYAIPAKPVPQFLSHWNRLLDQIQHHGWRRGHQQPFRLGIVGGGGGGVELSLTTKARLQRLLKADRSQQQHTPEIHLFHRGQELMTGHHPSVGRRFRSILDRHRIHLHLGETVSAISEYQPNSALDTESSGFSQRQIHCASGQTVVCDRVLWVTHASAPSWLRESGLATDSEGFIQVGDTLQSVSHPRVFAAGDVATMVNYPRPKAGVFAVRQGQPLFENLQRVLLGRAPQPFRPQRRYLALIGMGDGQAVAVRGGLCLGPLPLLWCWKDWIDRRFMEQFEQLPAMNQGQQQARGERRRVLTPDQERPLQADMRCAGCGSKVGYSVLERVLSRVQQDPLGWRERDDIVVGLETPDDAAVIQVPAGQLLVQTLDYFRSPINDAFIFGQIAANHCLSDLYAMGATPQSALAIASIPYAAEAKVEETLYQLLSGALKVLSQAQAVLIGGHTTEGPELAFGLTCNGLAFPEQILRKGGMQPGQALILTKALGTGTLLAAAMQLQAKGNWTDGAVESMLQSNQSASICLREHQATACTDVTGFGLFGHLAEMVKASQVSVELDLEAIPLLEGAQRTAQAGILSSLHAQNARARHLIQNLVAVDNSPSFPLLFDPQTSGGLLAAVPAERADACVAALRSHGYSRSTVIGRITSPTPGTTPIRITRTLQ